MLPPPRELPDRAPRLAEGRYVLLARVGRGGMAGVYAAWDTHMEEWRAVKVLLPKHARDKSLRNRFENEALTMRSLEHPNLVRVYDVGAGEKLPFIVMELVNAGSLYRWTKTYGGMPPRMACEAMIQLCAGLGAVHARGVVHRDIKPRNVLIHHDGVLKLTDFGIAQLENSQETRTGLAMGTLGFMSPEQLHDAKSVDLRTDIYAIGATLWTQLTARKARDLFRLDDKPTLMDGVPDVLRGLLAKCLAYERDDRYPTAESLAEALDEILSRLPEDPADTPPLPLSLGAPSFKSKPENTFSEILTLNPEDEGSLKVSRPPPPPRPSDPELRAPQKRAPRPIGADARQAAAPAPAENRTAAQILRHDQEDESLPSYMVGVEQPRDIRRAELISYSPEAIAAANAAAQKRSFRRVLLILFGAPFALALGVVVTLGGATVFGAWQLGRAREVTLDARVLLDDNVRFAEPLSDEIDALGGDSASLRAAFDRWASAPSEEARLGAAIEFVSIAEAEARPRVRGVTRSHEAEVVRQRIDKLEEVRRNLDLVTGDWTRVAGTPWGRLALGFGLAESPEDE